MPKLITFSCFMLFWVFYEMSGGSDFTPRERVITSQAPFTQNGQGPNNATQFANAPITMSASLESVATSKVDVE